MSIVSSVRAAPTLTTPPARRTAEAHPTPAPGKAPARAAEDEIHKKTKIETQRLANLTFAYTFIDADTGEVIGRWPDSTAGMAPASGKKLSAIA